MQSGQIRKYAPLVLSLTVALAVAWWLYAQQEQILAWGQFGYAGLFLISLLGNATVVIPAPGLLAVVTVLGAILNPILAGVTAGIGSGLGEFAGFLVGISAESTIPDTKITGRLKSYLEKYDIITLFTLALVPNPFFDIGGLLAGSMGVTWWRFLLPTVAGKMCRFVVIFLLAGQII